MKTEKEMYALVDKNNNKNIYQVSESYFVLLINKIMNRNSKIIKWK